MEKRVEQEKVVWSAKITKYQIQNILFLLYIYGLIIVIHSTGPQPIQLVLNPFNWSPNSSTGLFSAKMANFDKTNWYYLFIVHPPNPVKWSQAHSTGPHPIQLVPMFQYWLIQRQYFFHIVFVRESFLFVLRNFAADISLFQRFNGSAVGPLLRTKKFLIINTTTTQQCRTHTSC